MVRGAASGYLALALLIAPLLGLLHGLVHGPHTGTNAISAARVLPHGVSDDWQPPHAHHAAAESAAHDHNNDWLADLFFAHGSDSDCRVFGQLCHSDAVPALPWLVLPTVLSPFVFHFLRGEVLARWAALYQARGPPLAR